MYTIIWLIIFGDTEIWPYFEFRAFVHHKNEVDSTDSHETTGKGKSTLLRRHRQGDNGDPTGYRMDEIHPRSGDLSPIE